MEKIYKIALTFLFLSALPATIHAATLYFSPESGSYGVGENFTVTILINSNQSINATSGVLNFPTEYIEVVSLNKTNSIINLWVQNPSFSNAGNTGNIRFEGVILNPGFVGLGGKVADIVFRVKKVGLANVNFTESSILANDGLGTNVAVFPLSVAYTFIESKTLTPEKINTDLNKRIEEVENKIKRVVETPPSKLLDIKKSEPLGSFLDFWESLPNWLKVVIFIAVVVAVGIITLIFLFIIISQLVIFLIWLWYYIWHNIIKTKKIKKSWRKILAYLGMIKKEIKGDIIYSIHEFEEEFESMKKVPSLKTVWMDYWFIIGRVIKRFFTQNKRA